MQNKTKHCLYSVWASLKARCLQKSNKAYPNYGGRGITVCSRWLDKQHGFYNFVQDMGERPIGFSIDRINNNLGYFPENCRWADKKTQQRNQRVTRKIIVDGIEYIAAELAEKYNFKTDSLVERAKHNLCFSELIDKKKRIFTKGLALGGVANGVKQKAKTHCPNGHEYSETNTSYSPQGWRRCKECHKQKEAKRRSHLSPLFQKS